jgi:hypothetical protein
LAVHPRPLDPVHDPGLELVEAADVVVVDVGRDRDERLLDEVGDRRADRGDADPGVDEEVAIATADVPEIAAEQRSEGTRCVCTEARRAGSPDPAGSSPTLRGRRICGLQRSNAGSARPHESGPPAVLLQAKRAAVRSVGPVHHRGLRAPEIVADHGQRTPEERLEAFVRFLIEDLKDPMTNAIFFELWSIGQRDRFAMAMVDRFYRRYVANFDDIIAAINPKLDMHRRSTRAALMATQIEGLMILLAKGRPRHRYLVGIENECVAQLLRLAKQP